MTLAEITRYIKSYNRKKKQQAKEIAINNYILADLVGSSIGRLYKGTFPKIQEVYPSLFEEGDEVDEAIQEKKDQISAQRFLKFAQAYNKNYGGAN